MGRLATVPAYILRRQQQSSSKRCAHPSYHALSDTSGTSSCFPSKIWEATCPSCSTSTGDQYQVCLWSRSAFIFSTPLNTGRMEVESINLCVVTRNCKAAFIPWLANVQRSLIWQTLQRQDSTHMQSIFTLWCVDAICCNYMYPTTWDKAQWGRHI